MSSGKRILGPIPIHYLKLMSSKDRPAGVMGMLPEEIDAKQSIQAEKKLQEQIMGWLEIQGIFAGRQRMDKKSNIRAGYPDIWFCWKAGGETHPIAVECKIGDAKQTAEQLEAEKRMVRDGWLYLVIHSLPELIGTLTLLGSRDPSEPRQEQCYLCGNMASDWVDPEWASGRICRPCEMAHEPK